ncbi:hypothetical protein PVAP13_8NG176902 [Panicum virgatum]|uniref:Uncharacterized protein n=1 Tax=Panicum virgatum TaxID=38727 RepID=A0A8T0P674_PANVG|nr:hypothetical protein PVAP13_8NG176902 [Panicum virgatum]
MQIGCLQKMRRKKKRESIGGGIGSISNILDASQMTLKISPILHTTDFDQHGIRPRQHGIWFPDELPCYH